MKRSFAIKVGWCVSMVAGIAAVHFGSKALRSEGAFHHDRNSFAIQGSAYGRLLARLSEDTIDRVWHLGVEQIVPHSIDGSLPGGVADDDLPDAAESAVQREPFLTLAKNWFGDMRIAKYARTNSRSMSSRHVASVHKDVEEMLLRSYKMDPGHYGSYNSYHLFLTTHSFGGTPETKEHARKIANLTMNYVAAESEDPEPWLTAASAAVNLYILETEKFATSGTRVPVEILEKYREQIGYCLKRYEALAKQSRESGTWDNLTYERQFEIVQRARFSTRTFAQFDPMIERARNKQPLDTESKPDTAIAQSTENEGE